MTTSYDFDIGQNTQMRVLRDGKGEIVDDVAVFKQAVKMYDDYKTRTGKPMSGVQPKFVDWMREGIKFVENGGKMVDYKAQTITKSFADYSVICDHTNEINRRKAKSGEFATITEKKVIKG